MLSCTVPITLISLDSFLQSFHHVPYLKRLAFIKVKPFSSHSPHSHCTVYYYIPLLPLFRSPCALPILSTKLFADFSPTTPSLSQAVSTLSGLFHPPTLYIGQSKLIHFYPSPSFLSLESHNSNLSHSGYSHKGLIFKKLTTLSFQNRNKSAQPIPYFLPPTFLFYNFVNYHLQKSLTFFHSSAFLIIFVLLSLNFRAIFPEFIFSFPTLLGLRAFC